MKKYLPILLLFVTEAKAQTNLIFNRRFVECENQWVIFPKAADSSYAFGFIYIDEAAGLTLDLNSKFTISPTGAWIPKRISDSKSGSVKYRLEPNQQTVAIVPPDKYNELHITAVPDWLAGYQQDSNSIDRLYKWGFMYNSWDMPAKALTYLEKAQRTDSLNQGVMFELAYAYNALQQYGKAIPLLERSLLTKPNDCNLLKELSFSQVFIGHMDQADLVSRKAIKSCGDSALKSEIAINVATGYLKVQDKSNFTIWAAEVKKWAKPGDRFSIAISEMEAQLK